jgi:hypothetical protein
MVFHRDQEVVRLHLDMAYQEVLGMAYLEVAFLVEMEENQVEGNSESLVVES